MRRITIEVIFVSIISVIAIFLINTMSRNEYLLMSPNPIFEIVTYIVLASPFIFNHFILKYRILTNLIVSFIVLLIAFPLSVIIFMNVMKEIERIDKQLLHLEWQFKYSSIELPLASLLIVLLTELIYSLIRKKNNNKKGPVPNISFDR